MPDYYYQHFVGLQTPTSTRSRAQVFPGAVCPQKCQFGRLHGTSPARGSIEFKGTVMVPPGQIFWIQIGQSVFYGRTIKGEIRNSVSTGNSTTLQLVDMRDRLHDVNHFAQYNMMDEDGTWWHILAEKWESQIATYVLDLQDIEDFHKDQEIQELEEPWSDEGVPLFSGMTLLTYFAKTYRFTTSYSPAAQRRLRTGYPENLDFNGGTRVIECLEQICSKLSLQFTCWGDLHVHVDMRGEVSSFFERQLLAGNLNLCTFRGHVESALGGEINEQGRRVKIIGGRNSTEWFHPCYPSWNQKWTLELVNDIGFQLSIFLQSNIVTLIHKVQDLPVAYHDFNKYNGKRRREMTIKDYIDNIAYKTYRVDFDTYLLEITSENYNQFEELLYPGPILPPPGFVIGNFLRVRVEANGAIGYSLFDWDSWFLDGIASNSRFPISAHLPSDTTRQFAVKATTRKFDIKGLRDEDLFASGKRTWVLDGASLEIDDYIVSPTSGIGGVVIDSFRVFEATVCFSELRVGGSATKVTPPGGIPTVNFQWKPDQVYCRIGVDTNQYSYTYGEHGNAPRVREIIRSVPGLRKCFIDGVEVKMLTASLQEAGFTNNVFADDIARDIAERALAHQFITVAGHMTLKTNAGFMPSGIIDNVNVTFDSTRGTTETINFTNIRQDERVPVFHTPLRKRAIRGEEEQVQDRLRAEGKRILEHYNKENQAKPVARRMENNFDRLDRAHAFGGERNAAAVEVIGTQFPSDQNLRDGELLVVVHKGGAVPNPD